jgi:hypothetical protein
MTTEEHAELIANRVRDAVRVLILSGQQGTEVEVPEVGEIIHIERDSV